VNSDFPLTSDSLDQPGTKRGRLIGPIEFHSRVFVGTSRQYWVYVPAYTYRKIAPNLIVFQDGHRAISSGRSLRVPTVLDNLISKAAVGPTVGVFVTPGNLSASYPDNGGPSNPDFNPDNRSAEYTSVDDRYARMLIEELLPEVRKHHPFTDDPTRRVIGGASNGAVAAWTVAWHRPDAFRNVVSIVGSYTSEGYQAASQGQSADAGASIYPTLVRKTPIKPLKIFIQGSLNDLNNEHGNWYLGNLQMVSSIDWANAAAPAFGLGAERYELRQAWGSGGHTDRQGGMLLPDVLRWMLGHTVSAKGPLIGDRPKPSSEADR
jgi:enterochelin esterase family protein